MFRASAMAIAGAVLVTAGPAHAQDTTPAERAAVRAEVPWYERFTYGQGPSETMTGLGPSDRISQPAWTLSQRWGVTVDVRQAERSAGPAAPSATDQTAVGAYYQFTPRVRVGGRVSLREETPAETPAGEAAGVRLESAFRF